jgi:hypothetical protein
MDDLSKIFHAVLGIAFTLAGLSELPRLTFWMMQEAAKAQQHGIVSLTQLNHALLYAPKNVRFRAKRRAGQSGHYHVPRQVTWR